MVLALPQASPGAGRLGGRGWPCPFSGPHLCCLGSSSLLKGVLSHFFKGEGTNPPPQESDVSQVPGETVAERGTLCNLPLLPWGAPPHVPPRAASMRVWADHTGCCWVGAESPWPAPSRGPCMAEDGHPGCRTAMFPEQTESTPADPHQQEGGVGKREVGGRCLDRQTDGQRLACLTVGVARPGCTRARPSGRAGWDFWAGVDPAGLLPQGGPSCVLEAFRGALLGWCSWNRAGLPTAPAGSGQATPPQPPDREPALCSFSHLPPGAGLRRRAGAHRAPALATSTLPLGGPGRTLWWDQALQSGQSGGEGSQSPGSPARGGGALSEPQLHPATYWQ